jgi:HAD superfamily hydrolase (TIGR01458 family)
MERSEAERLDVVRAVLLDLDGVLYVEQRLVPGAREAVERLRSRGLELRFVTNTTSHSHPDTLRKLRRLGVPLEDSELVTPAALAVRHCMENGWHRASLLMAEDVKADFAQLDEDDERPDVVIVGDLGERFGYDVLNRAFRRLLDGAQLVALQKNRYWLRADGLSLDVGPFVAALEYASGREAYVVGKPAPGFFDAVLAGAGVGVGAAAMVGDDIESDIGGGLQAGLAAILVRTGKYRAEAVKASGLEPTAVVDSIADVPGLFGA